MIFFLFFYQKVGVRGSLKDLSRTIPTQVSPCIILKVHHNLYPVIVAAAIILKNKSCTFLKTHSSIFKTLYIRPRHNLKKIKSRTFYVVQAAKAPISKIRPLSSFPSPSNSIRKSYLGEKRNKNRG